jgi:hypothetical protein
MKDRQEQARDALQQLDSASVLEIITSYHGMQLFDEGFIEFLEDEGWLGPVEEDNDEEEDGDEDEEDDEWGLPGNDDYVISDCGPLGSRTVVSIQSGWADKSKYKQFDTEEEAVKAIKEDMAAQQYWPNVWKEDDHGGIGLYNILAD